MAQGPETDRFSTRGRPAGAAGLAAALALAAAGCGSSKSSTAAAAASAAPSATVSATALASASATGAPSTSASVPAMTSSSPAVPATTSSAAPKTSASSAAHAGGAGTNCGLEEASPNPDHLYLVIVSGTVTCAAAQKQMTAYLAYPDKQGSGGFATVNGWSCDHNSLAGFEDDGHYAECNGKDGDIVTQTANAKPVS